MNKKLAIFLVLSVLGLSLPFTSGVALDNTFHQPDYIINPSFEMVTPSWYLEDQEGTAILAFTHDDFDVYDGMVAAVVHTSEELPYYRVQLKQEDVSLEPGLYRVSFYARSLEPAEVTLSLDQQTEPWGNYGLWLDFETTNEWQQYTNVFTVSQEVTDGRLSFHLGKDVTTYFIDDINITNIDVPQTRSEEHLILNGDFEYPNLARWDWEDAYGYTDFEQSFSDSDSGAASAKITIDGPTNNDYLTHKIQLKQNEISLEKFKRYELKFSGKMGKNSSCPLEVTLIQDGYPWQSAGLKKTYYLNHEWQDFEHLFTAVKDVENSRFIFQLGKCRGEIYIDNVSLEKYNHIY